MNRYWIAPMCAAIVALSCGTAHAGYWNQAQKIGTSGSATAPATSKTLQPGQTGDVSDLSGTGGSIATYNMTWVATYYGETPRQLKISHAYGWGTGNVSASVNGPNGNALAKARFVANIIRSSGETAFTATAASPAQTNNVPIAAGGATFDHTWTPAGVGSCSIDISVGAYNVSQAKASNTTTTTVSASTSAHAASSDAVTFTTLP